MKQQFVGAANNIERRTLMRDEVLKYLRENLVPGETISTPSLMSALWPVTPQSEFLDERKKAVDILLGLARTEFTGICALQGPPNPKRMFMGKPSRPWLWYHPEEKPETVGFRCPHCNTLIAGIKGTG